MKLHSPAFEKKLRRRVRAEIRASPSLRREAKRLRRSRSTNAVAHGVHLIGLIGLAYLVGVAASNHASPDLLCAIITIWATGCAFNLAMRLPKTIYQSPDLLVFAHHPVSDKVVFDWQWAKCFRYSLWYLVDFLATFSLIALTAGCGGVGWLAVPVLAVAAWLVVLALAVWLALYHPHWSMQPIGIGLCGAVLLSGWLWPFMPAGLREWGVQNASLANLVLPTGWVPHTFRQLLPGGSAIHALLLFPAGFLISRLKPHCARLRELYVLVNFDYANVLSVPGQSTPVSDGPTQPSSIMGFPVAPVPRNAGVTEITDNIAERIFLKGVDWSQMELLERVVGRWLSPRERLVAEAMLLRPPEWSALWRKGCKTLLWGVAIGLLVGRFLPSAAIWILVWLGGTGVMMTLPFGSSLSRAFGAQFQGGVQLVFHSGFPVGYGEISRGSLKIAVVRWLAAIPVVLVFSTFLGWHIGHVPLTGLILGARGLVLALIAQPAILACLFSENTSDTRLISLRSLLLFAVVGGCALVFLGFSFAVFLAESHRTAGICLLVNAVVSCACATFYRWLFNRNCFDLIRARR